MVLLQPKLNLKVSQKQILTPGLVQMVSVLALNKLELADMINAELTENPVLEELDSSVPLLDEVSAREEKMDRDSSPTAQEEQALPSEEKDPFEEIDFGSFFKEYLDPGLRTSSRDGGEREALVRELPVEAYHIDRPPDVATGLTAREGRCLPRGGAGHRQSERRRLSDGHGRRAPRADG